MVRIIAKHIVKPECVDEFLRIMPELIKASQREEGNFYYNLHKAIDVENVYTMMETWQDIASIEAHNASPHFTTLVPKILPLLAEPAEVIRYEELSL